MKDSDDRKTRPGESDEESPFPDEVHDTRTMPIKTLGIPTTTLTERPWTVLVTLGVSVLCTIALAIVNAFGQYNTAETTLAKLVKALNAADVDTLLEDPELGFSERAERDMLQRGLEEYNQILSAYSTCSTAGLEQYRKLRQTVLLRGEETFKKLPGEEQRDIKQESKTVWLLAEGLEALGAEASLGIDDPAALTNPKKAAPHLLRLGLEELVARGEEGLPDLGELEAMQKKPKGSQKALLARVRNAGQSTLETIRKEVISAGLKRFKSLTQRERKNISSASYRLWIVKKGVELLDEEDAELVKDAESFLDTADEEAEARRLCLLILPPAQKTLIEGRNYNDFMAKRDDYIRSTGRERYERFLKALFKSCKYEVADSSLTGDNPWDLIRISRATLTLEWKECPGAAKFLGEVLTFRYEEGSWSFEPVGEQEPDVEVDESPEPQDDEVEKDEKGGEP